MRVIIQHNKQMSRYLSQYAVRVEVLGPAYKIMDIEEKHMPWLREIAEYIEPDFKIRLCKQDEKEELLINHKEMIVAFVGKLDDGKKAHIYYDIRNQTFEKGDYKKDTLNCWKINCFAKEDEITATEYIRCIQFLKEAACRWNKPIIIYANIEVCDEKYSCRSLMNKIISSFLAQTNGALITKTKEENICKYYDSSDKRFEFYINHVIYLNDSYNEAVKKAMPYLYISENPSRFKAIYKKCRQNIKLYENNTFYDAINEEQEIYVPLVSSGARSPAAYRELGFEYIPILGNYGMLYAKKSQFDRMREAIRLEVAYPYYVPIMSYPPCYKTSETVNFPYQVASQTPRYKGKEVYIGMISTDYVDYTCQALRTKDGRSRVAYIWEQTRGNEGNRYHNEQINEVLSSPQPQEEIKLPEEDSISTMLLSIAGGEREEPSYKGIATEAEFLVAKVNTAPEALQRIYGGVPDKAAATLADIVIGVMKLVNFATEKQKPLVLCIPFNSNIDPHDGSLIFYEMLGYIARRERITMIVPTGEEADKAHHYSIESGNSPEASVDIRVQEKDQNVVGIIYQKFSSITRAYLYPPSNVSNEPIDLKKIEVIRLKGAVIYTNGYRTSFLNGAPRLFFRLDNPQVGNWRVALSLSTGTSSQIDMWISQQELNKYVTLNPSTSRITIGSMGNANSVMTVGGYDEESMVILRGSGRGYSWDNRVKPYFVTHASNIAAPCRIGEWVNTTGSLVAASIMMGTAATIYSKCIAERLFPIPNTLVINSIILSSIRQFEGIEYPNPSYGYGVFDLNALNELLSSSFIL